MVKKRSATEPITKTPEIPMENLMTNQSSDQLQGSLISKPASKKHLTKNAARKLESVYVPAIPDEHIDEEVSDVANVLLDLRFLDPADNASGIDNSGVLTVKPHPTLNKAQSAKNSTSKISTSPETAIRRTSLRKAQTAKTSTSSRSKPADEAKKVKKRASEDDVKEAEKPLKKVKVQNPIKKGVKAKQFEDEEEIQTSKVPSIRIRTTPKALCTVLQLLKDPQKQVLREMGFGPLLGMKLDEISGTLGYFVLDNFDASELVLKLRTGPIKITRQVVHDMLGIPMGDNDFMSLPVKEIQENEESYLTQWRSQFGKSIRPSHLCSAIINSDETGLLFKLNFLMLFASTMVCCDASGACAVSCQTAIVNRICEDTEIHKLDWCGFLINYLKYCKNNWQPGHKMYHFTGPMTFLQLLYLDSTLLDKFPVCRERPAIKYWNSTCLRKRVTIELEVNRIFGELPLQPPFSESVAEEGFVASTSTPKVGETSSQTSAEEFHSILELIFSMLLNAKMQFENTLKYALSIFPDDVKLLEYDEKFHQLFRDPKPSTDRCKRVGN